MIVDKLDFENIRDIMDDSNYKGLIYNLWCAVKNKSYSLDKFIGNSKPIFLKLPRTPPQARQAQAE